jgi:hypothetical protein
MCATSEATANIAKLGLTALVLLWVTAAVGLLLEGLTRFLAFRVLFVSGLGLGGALYWRALRLGGLPSSLVDFDNTFGATRQAVHVSAPAGLAPAGL